MGLRQGPRARAGARDGDMTGGQGWGVKAGAKCWGLGLELGLGARETLAGS